MFVNDSCNVELLNSIKSSPLADESGDPKESGSSRGRRFSVLGECSPAELKAAAEMPKDRCTNGAFGG